MSRYLTTKLPGYLRRLHAEYERQKRADLCDVIVHSHYVVLEDQHYDNLDGGTYIHDILFFLPIEQLKRLSLSTQADLGQEIHSDLMRMIRGIRGEGINQVRIELEDENDPDFQRAVPYSSRPPINPDSLNIWKPDMVRVFISHRDGHKAAAHDLAERLEGYGFSCFVAHDTIPTNEEWRKVIVSALETMEVMLVFLTDDFQDSIWCMQEVGFALGKGVPYVVLKLEQRDPPGFIGHKQALKGALDSPAESATKLFPLLAREVGRLERIYDRLVAEFTTSQSYVDAQSNFRRLQAGVDKLTGTQIDRIVDAASTNPNLSGCYYLFSNKARLLYWLKSITGEDFVREGKRVIRLSTEPDF